MFHVQNGMHQHRAVLNCGEIMIDSAADKTISKQEGMKMRQRILRDDHIAGFREYLSVNEKSTVTISKYTRDAARFMEFAASRPVEKTLVLQTIGGSGIRVSEVTYFIKCSLTGP